jgi:hypothetical protein
MKKVINVLSSVSLKDIMDQITGKTNANKLTGHVQVLPVATPAPLYTTGKKVSGLSFIAGAFVLLMICTSLSSCFTSGYGCKGKSRIMTRVN